MKKLFFLICLTFPAICAKAQQTDINLGLTSGVFSFAGAATAKTSSINTYSLNPTEGYTNTPYRSNPGLTYGFAAQLQRITRKNLVFGARAGYEAQTSMDIAMIYGNTGNPIAASGQTTLTHHFINFNPYLGYQFHLECLRFELTGGLELAKPLSAQEKGKATDHSGNVYTTSLERNLIPLDVRTNLQLTGIYKRTSLSVAYSVGETNYMQGWVGGSFYVHSRAIRFGLSYKIN